MDLLPMHQINSSIALLNAKFYDIKNKYFESGKYMKNIMIYHKFWFCKKYGIFKVER